MDWIITSEERAAFLKLQNDEERDLFVERFWDERDPTPDTLQNEFKDEHYRRLQYARAHFSEGTHWRTPQARFHVMYGAPDEIGTIQATSDVSTGEPILSPRCTDTTAATETLWTYKQLPRTDHRVDIRFVRCTNGTVSAIATNSDAEFLSRVPIPYYKPICGGKLDLNRPPKGIVAFVCAENPPQPRFKDLAEVISHRVRFNRLPFRVEIASTPVTSMTSILKIHATWHQSALTWREIKGQREVTLWLFGRAINLDGRIEQSFEGEQTSLLNPENGVEEMEFEVPVFPGNHQVAIAVQDGNADRIGSYFSDWVAVYPANGACATPQLPAPRPR